MAAPDDKPMTFWDHLDALRDVILRVLAVAVAGFIVAFCFKEPLFRLILAPGSSDFVLYRWIASVADVFGRPSRIISQMAGNIFHEYQLLRITLRCSSLNLRIQRIYL